MIYLNPHEQAMQGDAIGWNPLDNGKVSNAYERDSLVGALRQVFEDLWFSKHDIYAPRARAVIQAALQTLLRFEGVTFIDFYRLLADKRFRGRLVSQINDDPDLHLFWQEIYRRDWADSVLNKITEFIDIRVVRNIVCQKRSAFNLAEALEEGKFVIINLAGLQESAANLLGALFVSRVANILKTREPLPSDQINPTACFLDEADKLGSTNLETLLSKGRQNKIALFITHQHFAQLNDYPVLKSGVLQASTVMAFQTDHRTAREVQGEFGPDVDLTRTPRHQVWIRSNKGGTGSTPTVDLILTRKTKAGDPTQAEAIKQHSIQMYGRHIQEVEAEIGQSYHLYTELKQLPTTPPVVVPKDQIFTKEKNDDKETHLQPPRQKQAMPGSDRLAWVELAADACLRHLE